MHKPAPVAYPIHDHIKNRWSPRAFAKKQVEPEKLQSLFEAARWAASAYNAQPWNFVFATSDEPEDFQRVLTCFVEANQAWAKGAPVIGITVAKLNFENGSPNRHAYHDVGQAAASLAIAAVELGLQIHQMAGINVEKTREALQIPADYDPVAGFALGYPGNPESLPEQLKARETAARVRKPAESFVFAGRWGQKPPIYP